MKYLVFLLLPFLVACAGTRAAFRAAEDLEDTAFVLAEQYDALIVEGARLRDTGALTGSALTTAQRVEARARPGILRLQVAATAWETVKSAENEMALSDAISAAVKVMVEMIEAIKVGQPSAELQRIEFSVEAVA